MTLAKVIVLVLTIVMGVTLAYGFTQGDLSADGAILMSIPFRGGSYSASHPVCVRSCG